ncbi:hypothetical protein HYR54_15000 [Candidatus Acetothermia bacterium]|nr:hypothetical protein [Candidatus Acetothermia bacterium]
MSGELQLKLLGSIQISLDGIQVEGFISAKAQALLCYLALNPQPHTRESLATLLWGEMPDEDARHNLRMTLANLTKLLPSHLAITRQTVALAPEASVWVDVFAFQQALQNIKSDVKAESLKKMEEAIELFQGDFLKGFLVSEAPGFEEWLVLERERLRGIAVRALQAFASHHAMRGEYAKALDFASRLLAIEPWREETHSRLMLWLVRSGQRSAALAQFEACRKALQEHLAVEPSEETKRLYERIRAAGTTPKHNLPPHTTPFVGREEELTDIRERLNHPDCKLLTLAGAGGIGKTRLALQVAGEMLWTFLDGVYFVPLAGVSAPEHVVTTIGSAVNFSFMGNAEPKKQLLNFLKEKEMILILDNFEHLIAEADLLTEIVNTAPHAKLLVTSREPLNLRAEWRMPIEGLRYPSLGENGDWNKYSAMILFEQSAQRVQPSFSMAGNTGTCVAGICRLLEGMPLGLELGSWDTVVRRSPKEFNRTWISWPRRCAMCP